MLAAAFASWIRQLPEREFDAPFLELLRAQGFYDIHFSHGGYEFGKDFIAKRDESEPVQYAFQSKAGDIGGSEWTRIRGQLEELADAEPAHPNYDIDLPRRSVLVMTGRLVGKATVAPTAFKNRLQRTGRGDFEVWDVDVLAELLAGSTRFPAHASVKVLPALGALESSVPNERDLERLLSALTAPDSADASVMRRAFVDNSIVVARLMDKGWPFLALSATLNAVRIGAVLSHGAQHGARDLLIGAMDQYVLLGSRLLQPLLEAPEVPSAWANWVGGGPTRTVAYAVACVRVLEYLGLSALHCEYQGRHDEAARNAHLCARVATGQPGCAHPISDRFAACFPPAIAALTRFSQKEAASRLVRSTTKWLCDRYEGDQFGLASVYSTPDEEVRTLLGPPFEFVQLQKRRESLIAVALADSAYVFLPDDYSLVVNDLRAVDIVPCALHGNDEPAGYFMNRGGTQPLINVAYPELHSPTRLAHHTVQVTPRVPELAGGPAVLLALGALLRDRLFTDVLPRLAAP